MANRSNNNNKKSSFELIGASWTRAFRCVWMLEELGIPYKIHELNPRSNDDDDTSKDLIQTFSPSGKVPILLEYDNDDDERRKPAFVLTESVAINTYLGDCFPETRLVPAAGTRARAIYDQTVCCILSELDAQGLYIYRKHSANLLGSVYGDIPQVLEPSRKRFTRLNAVIAAQLLSKDKGGCLGGPYIIGSTFTAADILYVHCLLWAKTYEWHKQGDDWPGQHLTAYLDRCCRRPAFQRANAMREESLQRMSPAFRG